MEKYAYRQTYFSLLFQLNVQERLKRATTPSALSPKVLPHSMIFQIRLMIQFVHVFAAAYFVHIEKFQFSFGVMFYTLGRLLNNWSVLRMRPQVLLVLG